MTTRDLKAEQRAVGTFRAANNGKMPDLNNPEERAQVYKIAYPSSLGLPAELKGTVDESLYYAGSAPAPAPAQQQAPRTLAQLSNSAEQAKGLLQKEFSPSNQNEFGRLIQDSIRRAAGYSTDKTKLGESEIFKAVGVEGMGALGASLQARSSEMIKSAADLSRVVNDLAGAYKAQGQTALRNYEIAVAEFEAEAGRIQQKEMEALRYKNELSLLERQGQLNKELEMLRKSLTTPTTETEPWIDEVYGGEAVIQEDGGSGVMSEDGGMMSVDPNAGKKVSKDGYTAKQIMQGLSWKETGGTGVPVAGLTGEMKSVFQFMPATWQAISSAYQRANGRAGGPLTMTINNERKVVEWKIQDLINKGWSAKDIGMIWNGSLAGTERPIAKKGTNNGIKYDTEAYGNTLANYMKKTFPKTAATTTTTTAIPLEQTKVYRANQALQDIGYAAGFKPTAEERMAWEKNMKSKLKAGKLEEVEKEIERAAVLNIKGEGNKGDLLVLIQMEKEMNDALRMIEERKMKDANKYKTLIERGKSWVAADKDQDWVKLIQTLAKSQSALRNKLFGASLTAYELKASNAFLIDIENDTLVDIITKMEGLRDNAMASKKIIMDFGIGKLPTLDSAPTPSIATGGNNLSYGTINVGGGTLDLSKFEN